MEKFGAFFVRKFVAQKKTFVQNSLCRRATLARATGNTRRTNSATRRCLKQGARPFSGGDHEEVVRSNDPPPPTGVCWKSQRFPACDGNSQSQSQRSREFDALKLGGLCSPQWPANAFNKESPPFLGITRSRQEQPTLTLITHTPVIVHPVN